MFLQHNVFFIVICLIFELRSTNIHTTVFPTCVELDIIRSLFFDTDTDITNLYIIRMRAADIGNMMND